MRPNPRFVSMVLLLLSGACSGSISCSGCGGLNPIPGGFPAAARIERAAQIRLTQGGMDFIETEFQNLMQAYVRMDCGGPTDVPCPTGFRELPGGVPNPASCDLGRGVCVETISSAPGPLIGFEIEQSTQSNAIICRDDINDPARRRCYAWLRFEGLQLVPQPSDTLVATITAQLDTTEIPFRYDTLGMDCLVRLNSAATGGATQDIVANARLGRWVAPSGVGGGQLKVTVDSVDAMIPDGDVEIERDPIHGDILDSVLCGVANLGVIKNALIPQLTGSLADIVGEEVNKALGWRCGQPGNIACPALTTCNSDFYCEEAGGAIVPVELGLEGRLDFSQLLGGLTGGRPGEGDLTFIVGGNSGTDTTGALIGALGGAEVVIPDPICATILPSPRLRPGWVTPPPLPTTNTVDLDLDVVTPETPYMVAAGVSQAFLDQVFWTIYTTGLLCTSISSNDIDLLHTGPLGLILPSLAQLTHSDRYPRNNFPARLSIRPSGEPRVTIGSGKITRAGNGTPTLVEPLIEVALDDLEINFYALIEERWVRLMTVRLDLALGLGADVNAANEIELVIGDLADAVTDVHVSNSELLAEDPAELEMSIPALLGLALPMASGAFPGFALPSATDLGGFEMTVLGIRGVRDGAAYPNLAIYANLGFDPTAVPNLSLSAETTAELTRLDLPAAGDFSVTHAGGPVAPVLHVALGGRSPVGTRLEHQIRVDGSLWSPFFEASTVELRRPELLAQGRHKIEVRARPVGDYRSLDPTPVELDVVIDPEGPRLQARIDRSRGGIIVLAYDVVSEERLTFELTEGNNTFGVTPAADGFVGVDAIDGTTRLAFTAIDEVGNRTTHVFREGPSDVMVAAAPTPEVTSGCTCAGRPTGQLGLLLVAGLFVWGRRRR